MDNYECKQQGILIKDKNLVLSYENLGKLIDLLDIKLEANAEVMTPTKPPTDFFREAKTDLVIKNPDTGQYEKEEGGVAKRLKWTGSGYGKSRSKRSKRSKRKSKKKKSRRKLR